MTKFKKKMALEALRSEGNTMFTKGRWSKAITKYGEYIAILSRDGENQDAQEKLVIGYSNRAEAWLKLKKYVQALEDCERALKVDKTHLKSLMRKARALEGLHLYQEVALTYRELLGRPNLGTVEKQWTEGALKVAETRDRQSRFGCIESDFEEHWDGVKAGPSFLESAPALEEFVGPVEIRRTSTMGRGLFATRDVEEGELLMVSNAWTSNRFPLEYQVRPLEKTIDHLLHSVQDVVREASENTRDFSHLQRLIQLDTLGGPYPDDSLYRDAPPMRYFIPVNALTHGSWRVTEEDLNHPALQNDLNTDFLRKVIQDRQLYQHGSKLIKISEIYVLPSLMNHSCSPNVSALALYNDKASRVFRAARFIRAGEELCHAYHNIFCPLDERRMLVGGILCECQRCALELELLQEVSILNYMASECTDLGIEKESEDLSQYSIDDLSRVQRRCITAVIAVNSLFREIPKLAKLSEEKKDWVRATFIRFVRLMLDPSMKRLPDLSAENIMLQRRLIADSIRSMLTVDPTSDIALAMCSEAARDAPIIYNPNTDSIEKHENIEDVLSCSRRIIELTYGPEMTRRTTYKIFISSEGRLIDLPF